MISTRAKVRAIRRERARRINELCVEGKTPDEIASAVGIRVRNLWDLASRWGFPLSQRKGFRRLFAWVADDQVEALDRIAADMGADRSGTLARLLAAVLADDGTVARRQLGVKRRVAA